MSESRTKNPQLSRFVPARTHIEHFTWVKRNFWTYNADWRRIRAKSRKPLNHCKWCKRQFEEGEKIALAGRMKGANWVLCNGCVSQMENAT